LQRTNILEELVELTRQYDTWDWEKYNNQKARQLHLLFEQIGYEKYIEIMTNILENNDEIIFLENEMNIINEWEKAFQEDSKEILKNMIVYNIEINNQNYKVGYIFTPYKYRNDFSKILKENNSNDIDLVGMFFPNMDVVSYRGVKQIDVSIVPTYFGGKGHKGAGTNPINNEKFREVLKIVNFN
jgi:oligoribonuclease NrnB/cAMP/cGMP phosphodiesterase (DHH superfamily)